MAGILYGVGVGPGDPELVTIKAARVLKTCDVIGIPARDKNHCTAFQIACKAVPEIEKKPVAAVPIPMTTDKEILDSSYNKGCDLLSRELKLGKTVAFLNLGDPSVYGTYMEIHERMAKLGYCVRLVSGVPSFCAAASALGIPLALKKEHIHILPGCYGQDDEKLNGGTRILMKSGGKISQVKRELVDLEEAGKIKAYAVTNCGMEHEVIYQNIRDLDESAGYFTTIIIKEKWNDL